MQISKICWAFLLIPTFLQIASAESLQHSCHNNELTVTLRPHQEHYLLHAFINDDPAVESYRHVSATSGEVDISKTYTYSNNYDLRLEIAADGNAHLQGVLLGKKRDTTLLCD